MNLKDKVDLALLTLKCPCGEVRRYKTLKAWEPLLHHSRVTETPMLCLITRLGGSLLKMLEKAGRSAIMQLVMDGKVLIGNINFKKT